MRLKDSKYSYLAAGHVISDVYNSLNNFKGSKIQISVPHPSRIDFKKFAAALDNLDLGNHWCKREYVEHRALKKWKLSIFKTIANTFNSILKETNLSSAKPASSFRRFKQGIQEFHRKYALVPADKAENSVQLHFFNILSKSFMVQKPTNYIFQRMRSMWLMNIAAIEPLS